VPTSWPASNFVMNAACWLEEPVSCMRVHPTIEPAAEAQGGVHPAWRITGGVPRLRRGKWEVGPRRAIPRAETHVSGSGDGLYRPMSHTPPTSTWMRYAARDATEAAARSGGLPGRYQPPPLDEAIRAELTTTLRAGE